MGAILERIVEYKRAVELPQRMQAVPPAAMQARAVAAPPPRDFVAALRAVPGVALIAEVKRASPSRGVLRADFDPRQLAALYAAHGAAAISVLTDAPFFQGDLAHLTAIRAQFDGGSASAAPEDGAGEQVGLLATPRRNDATTPRRGTPVPLLRKDFIIDPYQVYEARTAGADAVLLIAAVLDDGTLAGLLELAHVLGMAALVEVHSAEELARVRPLQPTLIGINNRDLRDFRVDLETCLTLRALVPPDACCVAESGIHTPADVARLRAAGMDAMLVGEALLRAPDVAVKVQELVDGQG
jgi:indole-3-glycerol phosphate synthase